MSFSKFQINLISRLADILKMAVKGWIFFYFIGIKTGTFIFEINVFRGVDQES